jgi:hypothetical protein
MSGVFEVAVQTAAAAAGAAYAEFQNTDAANGRVLHLVECGFTTNAATLSKVGLIRSAAVGVASGTPSPGQTKAAYDVTTPKGQVVVNWSSPATIAATPYFFRQLVAAAVAGSGTVWPDQSDAWEIPPGGSLLLWNFDGSLSGSILSAFFKWRE